jgi:hypothetical protein
MQINNINLVLSKIKTKPYLSKNNPISVKKIKQSQKNVEYDDKRKMNILSHIVYICRP